MLGNTLFFYIGLAQGVSHVAAASGNLISVVAPEKPGPGTSQAGLNNTVEVTKRVKAQLGSRLNLVEVGNEPNGYHSWCRTDAYTEQDYVNEWNTRADIISREVFNCRSSHDPCWENYQGLVLAEYNKFSIQGSFAKGINKSGHLKSISIHYYAGDFHNAPTLDGIFMNHTRRVVDMGRIVDHWNAIRVHNPDVEMTFGETNMWSDSHGQEALETVFGSALFYVDYCMFGMSQNISRYNIIQGTDRDHASWVAVPFKGEQPHFKPNMYGQLFAADAIGAGGNVQVKSVELGIDTFSSYAIYENGKLARYMLIDMDIWNANSTTPRGSRSVTVAVPKSAVSVTVRRLEAASTDANQGITLAGVSWKSENSRLVQVGSDKKESGVHHDGKATITLNSSEAVIVSFS